jgi:hypothetical protein
MQLKIQLHPTEPAPISAFLVDSFKKYLINADGFHSNQEPSTNWSIHLVFFAFVEEKRTSKPVFS